MTSPQIKTDLIKYLKNSILLKVKELARFPDTISSSLLSYLYKDIVQKTTTQEILNYLMFYIFEFRREQSDAFYAFVQEAKKRFQDFLDHPDDFYADADAQRTFQMEISDKQQPACGVGDLLGILSGSPVMVKLEHKALIQKKYDKNLRKLFAVCVKNVQDLSAILRIFADFGSICAAFLHNKQAIIQFCGYESVLAICYKQEEIKLQLNTESLEIFAIFASKAGYQAETTAQPSSLCILSKLPQELQKSGIFACSAVNFKFVKAVYTTPAIPEDAIILQFHTPNSCQFFQSHFKAEDIECRLYSAELADATRILRPDVKEDDP